MILHISTLHNVSHCMTNYQKNNNASFWKNEEEKKNMRMVNFLFSVYKNKLVKSWKEKNNTIYILQF